MNRVLKRLLVVLVVLSFLASYGLVGCKEEAVEETMEEEAVEETMEEEAAPAEGETVFTTKSGVKYIPKTNEYGFETVAPDEVVVGDIIIVAAHEFQIRQRAAFEMYCKQEGATVIQDAGEFDPERQRQILESMVAKGVQVVNFYGLDSATSKAQSEYLAENEIFSVLQWEDFDTIEYPWPVAAVITSDNNAASGGEFAAKWFEEKYGEDAKAIVGIIDQKQFKNATMRATMFKQGFESVHPNVEFFVAEGKGSRDPARQAGEALIQANPEMQVGFGINDDSTLGFMAALEAAGKNADNFCLIGFDGTIAAYDAMKRGTMFKADVAQDPEAAGYNGAVVAVQIARGEKTFGDFPRQMLVNVCTLVTLDNIDPFYEKAKAAVDMIKGLE